MRFSPRRNRPQSGDLSADAASRQRQILDRLSADYSRHVHELLRHRELIKGSVYETQTRCGNPSCHCAKPRGVRHAATVLSWSEAGKTRIRSLPKADRARMRRLTESYRHLRQARRSGQTAPADPRCDRPSGAGVAAAAARAEPAQPRNIEWTLPPSNTTVPS